jgi:poly(3-hydroxybutyrate) depolymerase
MNDSIIAFRLRHASAGCGMQPTHSGMRAYTPLAATPNSPSIQTRSLEGQIRSSSVSRHYILHVPACYRGDSLVPLLLNFQGYGSNSRQEEALSGTSVKADKEGFIVAYPDGLAKASHTGPGCRGNVEVILYALANHGHSWPGSPVMPKEITLQAVNATDVMQEFFKRHPMP